ncbi:hypothetical protein [Tannerella forsythia]|uniref:hypothetical protein n=1 Tax=Tannerella forsythia TaxID=28112 RepID=UPI000618BF29|nr:hypothetical protein [Tannerella forsythia]BAR48154.1 hypothetical protein TF3313_0575 [Tannerella forsythia 3313]
MSLADAFPENIKKDFADRSIDIGKTLLIEIPQFNLSYAKYFIIVALTSTKVAGVVINTEINENVAYNEHIRSMHLPISQHSHTFLKYDSYVDCANLHKKPFDEIYNAIVKNPKIVVGNITDELLREIHHKITFSTTITRKDKKEFGFCEDASS